MLTTLLIFLTLEEKMSKLSLEGLGGDRTSSKRLGADLPQCAHGSVRSCDFAEQVGSCEIRSQERYNRGQKHERERKTAAFIEKNSFGIAEYIRMYSESKESSLQLLSQ